MGFNKVNLESQSSEKDQKTSGNMFSVRNIAIGLTGIILVIGGGLIYAFKDHIFGSKKDDTASIADSSISADRAKNDKNEIPSPIQIDKNNASNDPDSNDDEGDDNIKDRLAAFFREKLDAIKNLGVSSEQNYFDDKLCKAILTDNVENVKSLIKNSAYANIVDSEIPALLWASFEGHKETVELLLDKGAYIEAADQLGNTALIWASGFGHNEIVKLLLKEGANIEAVGENDSTALLWACLEGRTETVELLLDKGANVDAVDDAGSTALKLASDCGYNAIVELLKKKINAKAKQIQTN